MGSLPWETVLHKFLQRESFPRAAALHELLQQRSHPSGCSPSGAGCSGVGPPQGHKSCQQTCSGVGSTLHKVTGPARSLLQREIPMESQPPSGAPACSGEGSFPGYRWISAPQWTSMGFRGTTCLTMVCSTSCRGIAAPVPGAPPPPPSSLTLVTAELLLSHHVTPLSCCKCSYTGGFFSPPYIHYYRGTTTIADGLSLSQWQAHLGAGWHCLYRTRGKLLVASHRSHPCSPPLSKPCQANPVQDDKKSFYNYNALLLAWLSS